MASYAGCISSRVIVLFFLLQRITRGWVCIAQPISAPDIATCHLPFNLPAGEKPFNCCAPKSDRPAVYFHLNESAEPVLRIRKPAHTLGPDYAQKLLRGYELMRALPENDPRSFVQQANIHCAYCNSVYLEPNTSRYYQIHNSWLFFPFHRWYLYFHERILAKLLADDTFALPFWNYDHPEGVSIPSMYVDYPGLSDIIREPSHAPPAVVILDYPNQTERTTSEQLQVNSQIMYYVMISGASTKYGFFGKPLRRGAPAMPGHGTVEGSPHNTVHTWVGNAKMIGWRDMGSFYAAARDPVFYAHHGNIDRLWDVWKSIDPDHRDIDDPDYLNSEFTFYNEDAKLVRVKVGDSLDSAKLGYKYEDVENVWINASSAPLSHGPAALPQSAIICTEGELLLQPCSLVVSRDPQRSITSSQRHETLLLENIQVGARDMPARFDVFVNLPTATEETTLGCAEYAGTFSMLPQFVADTTESKLRTSLRLASLDFIVKQLGLAMEHSLIVTIVARSGSPCSISGVRIEFEESEQPVVMAKRSEF